MSFWRQGLKNAGFLTLQAVLVRGGGLVVNLFLARMLTPSGWGLFNAIISANSTLYQSTKFSIDSALHVRLSETRPDADGVGPADFAGAGLIVMGGLAIVAMAISIVLAGPVAVLFGAPELEPWMYLVGAGTAAQFVSWFGMAALFGANDFRALAIINAVATGAYLAFLAVGWVAGPHEFWVVVAAYFLSQIGAAIWTAARGWTALRLRGATPRFKHAGKAAARLLAFGFPLYLSSFFPSIATFFLTAELSREHGVGSLAGLRVALTLSQVVLFLPGAVSQAFISEFARARSEDQFPARDFARYLKFVTASTVLTMLAVAAIAPDATPILFGKAYSPAVDAVFVAVMAAGVQTIKQAILVGYISERRTGYALVESLLSTGALMAIGFSLVPDYGVSGLLIAQAASQAVSVAALLSIVIWRMRRDDFLGDFLAVSVAIGLGIAATAAGHWTAENPWHLPLFLGLLLVAFLTGGYGLIRRNERERFIAIARELASSQPQKS